MAAYLTHVDLANLLKPVVGDSWQWAAGKRAEGFASIVRQAGGFVKVDPDLDALEITAGGKSNVISIRDLERKERVRFNFVDEGEDLTVIPIEQLKTLAQGNVAKVELVRVAAEVSQVMPPPVSEAKRAELAQRFGEAPAIEPPKTELDYPELRTLGSVELALAHVNELRAKKSPVLPIIEDFVREEVVAKNLNGQLPEPKELESRVSEALVTLLTGKDLELLAAAKKRVDAARIERVKAPAPAVEVTVKTPAVEVTQAPQVKGEKNAPAQESRAPATTPKPQQSAPTPAQSQQTPTSKAPTQPSPQASTAPKALQASQSSSDLVTLSEEPDFVAENRRAALSLACFSELKPGLKEKLQNGGFNDVWKRLKEQSPEHALLYRLLEVPDKTVAGVNQREGRLAELRKGSSSLTKGERDLLREIEGQWDRATSTSVISKLVEKIDLKKPSIQTGCVLAMLADKPWGYNELTGLASNKDGISEVWANCVLKNSNSHTEAVVEGLRDAAPSKELAQTLVARPDVVALYGALLRQPSPDAEGIKNLSLLQTHLQPGLEEVKGSPLEQLARIAEAGSKSDRSDLKQFFEEIKKQAEVVEQLQTEVRAFVAEKTVSADTQPKNTGVAATVVHVPVGVAKPKSLWERLTSRGTPPEKGGAALDLAAVNAPKASPTPTPPVAVATSDNKTQDAEKAVSVASGAASQALMGLVSKRDEQLLAQERRLEEALFKQVVIQAPAKAQQREAMSV